RDFGTNRSRLNLNLEFPATLAVKNDNYACLLVLLSEEEDILRYTGSSPSTSLTGAPEKFLRSLFENEDARYLRACLHKHAETVNSYTHDDLLRRLAQFSLKFIRPDHVKILCDYNKNILFDWAIDRA